MRDKQIDQIQFDIDCERWSTQSVVYNNNKTSRVFIFPLSLYLDSPDDVWLVQLSYSLSSSSSSSSVSYEINLRCVKIDRSECIDWWRCRLTPSLSLSCSSEWELPSSSLSFSSSEISPSSFCSASEAFLERFLFFDFFPFFFFFDFFRFACVDWCRFRFVPPRSPSRSLSLRLFYE